MLGHRRRPIAASTFPLAVTILVVGCTGAHGRGSTHADPARGLEWQAEASRTELTWAEARAYCEALELSGRGWRLPTETELGRLRHATEPEWAAYRGWRSHPEPPTQRDTGAAGIFWTASVEETCNDADQPPPPARGPVAPDGHAWVVHFGLPPTSTAPEGRLICVMASDEARVRCVRDVPRASGSGNEGASR